MSVMRDDQHKISLKYTAGDSVCHRWNSTPSAIRKSQHLRPVAAVPSHLSPIPSRYNNSHHSSTTHDMSLFQKILKQNLFSDDNKNPKSTSKNTTKSLHQNQNQASSSSSHNNNNNNSHMSPPPPVKPKVSSPPQQRRKVKTKLPFPQWGRAHSKHTPQNPPLKLTKSQLRNNFSTDNEKQYTSIGGRIYDITEFRKYHPGGEAILEKYADGRECGAIFNKYHMWVNVESLLGNAFVGLLKPEDNSGARYPVKRPNE